MAFGCLYTDRQPQIQCSHDPKFCASALGRATTCGTPPQSCRHLPSPTRLGWRHHRLGPRQTRSGAARQRGCPQGAPCCGTPGTTSRGGLPAAHHDHLSGPQCLASRPCEHETFADLAMVHCRAKDVFGQHQSLVNNRSARSCGSSLACTCALACLCNAAATVTHTIPATKNEALSSRLSHPQPPRSATGLPVIANLRIAL